ncbi:hypothetical protein AK51_29595 [Serratia nematodiphila DZ0503SBS1]|nr:hypothetical protein AK51_29595 [Serratia nematodiphila DZ0503SBS1]
MNQEIHAAPLALVGIGCALPGIDRIDLSNGAAWSALFDAPPPMPWSDAAAPIRGRQIDDAAFDFKNSPSRRCFDWRSAARPAWRCRPPPPPCSI